MNTAPRPLLLRVFIGFLVLSALIAVVCVLTGSLNHTTWRVIATTLSISAGSIGSMSCLRFAEIRRQPRIGRIGAAPSIAAALLTVTGVWLEPRSEPYWKSTATCALIAIACAHACLLWIAEGPAPLHRIQQTATATLAVLALLLILSLWAELDSETYYRVIAAISVLVVLFTLLVPLIARRGAAPASLVLHPADDGCYADASGRLYRVTPVDPDTSAPDSRPL